MSGAAPACRFLEWDSAFFGVRIGRILASSLEPSGMASALSWCRQQELDAVYLLAASGEPATHHVAERNGFELVDVRVTLECELGERPHSTLPSEIVEARESDIPLLRDIAGAGHGDSRFYADARFARDRCDELYRVWIEKSCRSSDETVLTLLVDGRASGYVSCAFDGDRGSIGLVGVASSARGRGVGSRLLAASLDLFASRGVRSVSVVTQGRNVGAQRLYQAAGFRTRDVALWFHKWFSPSDRGGPA